MPLELRPLGSQGLIAPMQGYGAMGLTTFYASDVDPAAKEAEGLQTIARYVELTGGHALINTAWLYHGDKGGPHNMEIIGKAIKQHGREKFIITAKLGASLQSGPDCSEAGIRKHLEDSLRWLGTDYLDVFIQNRQDPKVPVEQVAETAKKLVKEGKIKYWGLSEASANEIRRGHAVFPVTLIEQEWSLPTRDLEAEVIPTCRELGIGVLAYSPLGRGMLTGAALPGNDLRSHLPRFSGENLEKNKSAVERLGQIAAKRGCTPAQLALAWVQSRGKDVFPIPGTRSVKRLEENVGAASIKLTPQEIEEIEAAVPVAEGSRYPESMQKTLFNARQ